MCTEMATILQVCIYCRRNYNNGNSCAKPVYKIPVCTMHTSVRIFCLLTFCASKKQTSEIFKSIMIMYKDALYMSELHC